jgi:hypothetical protein
MILIPANPADSTPLWDSHRAKEVLLRAACDTCRPMRAGLLRGRRCRSSEGGSAFSAEARSGYSPFVGLLRIRFREPRGDVGWVPCGV